ncbi:hypothetical protein L1987_00597 [Smallanthus sonchifolius]|uniref:Uncharacterized protein n=1 Tax=Smallanthus sonchifolius TaxID=185202 RepID=A0ACB9K2Z0_9ASTR|nr:hypothetical protein L1987_00597 [Smallanthus sonchifolius]
MGRLDWERKTVSTYLNCYVLIFDVTGYLCLLRRNGQRFDLTPRDTLPFGNYYHRATLDSDGVFTQYYHPKNSIDNTRWEVIWFEPEKICNRDSEIVGSGACGLNNVCSLVDDRTNCECPAGFSLLDSNDPNGDCNPDFTPSCDEGYQGDVFNFMELTDIDWPDSNYAHINPTDEQSCKRSCVANCFVLLQLTWIGNVVRKHFHSLTKRRILHLM